MGVDLLTHVRCRWTAGKQGQGCIALLVVSVKQFVFVPLQLFFFRSLMEREGDETPTFSFLVVGWSSIGRWSPTTFGRGAHP